MSNPIQPLTLPDDVLAAISEIPGLAESCYPSLAVDRIIAKRRLSIKKQAIKKPVRAWRKVTFKLPQDQYEELEVLYKLKAAPSISAVVKLCLALGIVQWYKQHHDNLAGAVDSISPEQALEQLQHPEDRELPQLGHRELSAPWTSPQPHSPTLGAEI